MVLLSRQNALRRASDNHLSALKRQAEPWLSECFNKPPPSCSPGGGGGAVHSLYWQIPDPAKYLTSIAMQENPSDLFAIAGGGKVDNLFIYQLEKANDENTVLTHHQTITLPNICSLDWMPTKSNHLVTGQRDGMVHVVKLGNPQVNEPAEIVKRYNHLRHIKKSSPYCRISKCQVLNSWISLPSASIATLSSETLFIWDHSRSDVPLVKLPVPNASTFDMSTLRDGVGCVGNGMNELSLIDIRLRDAIRQESKRPPPLGGGLTMGGNVSWCPSDSNLIASTSNNMVMVWDARYFTTGPMCTYSSHKDIVNTITWSNGQVYSASSDATIRVWNVKGNDNSNNDAKQEPPQTDDDWLGDSGRRAQNRRYAMIYAMQSQTNTQNKDNQSTVLKQSRDIVSIKPCQHNEFVTISASGDFALHYYKHNNHERQQQAPVSSNVVKQQNVVNYSVPFNVQRPKDEKQKLFAIHDESICSSSSTKLQLPPRRLVKTDSLKASCHQRSKSSVSRLNSSCSLNSNFSHKRSKTLSSTRNTAPLQPILV